MILVKKSLIFFTLCAVLSLESLDKQGTAVIRMTVGQLHQCNEGHVIKSLQELWKTKLELCIEHEAGHSERYAVYHLLYRLIVPFLCLVKKMPFLHNVELNTFTLFVKTAVSLLLKPNTP